MPVYNCTTLDDPAAAGGRGTFAEGINDAGQIVGLSKTASRANTNSFGNLRNRLRSIIAR